jgi:hypothetical protein
VQDAWYPSHAGVFQLVDFTSCLWSGITVGSLSSAFSVVFEVDELAEAFPAALFSSCLSLVLLADSVEFLT